MQQFYKNNNLLALFTSIVIIIVLFICGPFLAILNKSIQNQYYGIKNTLAGLDGHPNILVVELDEQSFSKIGSFPFPRSVYAEVINNLEAYNVSVIALDILFLDPSNEEDDTIFIQSLSGKSQVVLGASIDTQNTIHLPFNEIPIWSYKTGYLHPNIERANNTVYSFTPKYADRNAQLYEHFSVQVLRGFYKYLYGDTKQISKIGEYSESEYIFSQDISYPLATKNSDEILINFIPEKSFTSISFSDLYDTDRIKVVDRQIGLQDKIILIGPAAEGLKDEFFTPNGRDYGVYIHANILNTLLSKGYMIYFNKNLEWILIFLLIILSVYTNLSRLKTVLIGGNIVIIIIFWFIIPLSILLGTNLIFNYPSQIIFSLLLAFSGANIVKYLIEDMNKKKLNKALGEYVGVNIADEILGEQGKVNLDGEKKELICFFSDIAGFTSMSESLSPEELVSFLREYLSEMTSIIMDQGGHVDKYEGDAIMALWGAFHNLEDDDYHKVCSSALLQQKAIKNLNSKWKKKFGKNVSVRMGIHSGPAIVGNIGALGKKMDFTALGDSVNLASRLEGVNKFYGTSICVSEEVYKKVKEDFICKYLDMIQVKGKDVPVKIYELFGKKEDFHEEYRDIYERFLAGVQLYKEMNFQEARIIFRKLAEQGDNISQIYETRCTTYIKNPPSSDWDGVWRMTEK